MPKVSLPNNWHPRGYQENFWRAMEQGTQRNAVQLWHRRTGKDLTDIHWCATQAFQRKGLYWHVLPTYAQGRKIIWDGMDNDGRPFLEAFPEETRIRVLDDEMKIWLKGGSIYQVVGSDKIDSLVGSNPVGIIYSEYALQNPAALDLLDPIIEANRGWQTFPYTPRGRNHGYDLFKFAQEHPKTHFSEKLTVDDTKIIEPEQLALIREKYVSKGKLELFKQEYYCSFDAALVGAYYKDQLSWMTDPEKNDPSRISDRVNWMPDYEVVTGWDLGHSDSTAIWFAQVLGNELRLIDYYENHGEPIDHYVRYMRSLPYTIGDCFLPHDAAQTLLQTGRSTLEVMQKLGVRTILNPKIGISDQHEVVRLMLRQSWIHETKCKRGIQALREYSKKPVEGMTGPSGEQLYSDKPLHNWASHGASALATLMYGFRPERIGEFKQPSTEYVL